MYGIGTCLCFGLFDKSALHNIEYRMFRIQGRYDRHYDEQRCYKKISTKIYG